MPFRRQSDSSEGDPPSDPPCSMRASKKATCQTLTDVSEKKESGAEKDVSR